MKKTLFLFWVIGLIAISLYAKSVSDVQEMDLKGSVKSMIDKYNEYHFLENGFIDRTNDRKGGNVVLYKYDAQGRLISKDYQSSGDMETYSDVFSYDTQGRLISETSYSMTFPTIFTFEYDAKGRLTGKKVSDLNNALSHREDYVYDDAGNVIKESRYNSSNKLEYYTLYKYDKNNNQIESATYKPDKTLTSKTERTYNSKNQCIKSYEKYGDSSPTTSTYTYDDHGNYIVDETFEHNTKRTTRTNHTYVYDAVGNWTDWTVYWPNGNVRYEKRIFTYY